MDETATRHWQDRWQLSPDTDYTTGPTGPQIAQQPSLVLGVGGRRGVLLERKGQGVGVSGKAVEAGKNVISGPRSFGWSRTIRERGKVSMN